MAFDPTKYNVVSAKPLPVILLLDTSSSMSGAKIQKLHTAAVEMIKNFEAETLKEIVINVSIITFGSSITLHTPLDSVDNLVTNPLKPFTASGNTPLGGALRMAKDMIEDKSIIPAKSYAPAVVLVSDGQPNDQWEDILDNFISDGRTAKSQRFAISIGSDADDNMLLKFVSKPENLLYSSDANDIAKNFKNITMSVSLRSKSVNPDIFNTINLPVDSDDNKSVSNPASTDINEDESDDYEF